MLNSTSDVILITEEIVA